MHINPVVVLTALAALGSAAVGGVFCAFSTFVMRGLDRTHPAAAITAMRNINAEAQANGPFLALFVGSAALAAVLGVVAVRRVGTPGSWFLLAGAVLGVLGFLVTVAFNVPLNDHLDTVDPAAPEAADEWRAYLSTWTAWNHLRTATGFVGAALMLGGLRSE
jgi:uncharacterized membrane protein